MSMSGETIQEEGISQRDTRTIQTYKDVSGKDGVLYMPKKDGGMMENLETIIEKKRYRNIFRKGKVTNMMSLDMIRYTEEA